MPLNWQQVRFVNLWPQGVVGLPAVLVFGLWLLAVRAWEFGRAAKRVFCPLLWAKLVLRRGVFLVIWLCSLSTTFLKQNTPQAPPAATLLVTPSKLGARGGAPAFFFSIFLLMPKEIWPGLGWKPSSRNLEAADTSKKTQMGFGAESPKKGTGAGCASPLVQVWLCQTCTFWGYSSSLRVTAIESSSRFFSSTKEGHWVISSLAFCTFGKAITSRMFSFSSIRATRRSRP